ncbi:MAG: histidine kinase [Cyclobacteriaceae bacterium]
MNTRILGTFLFLLFFAPLISRAQHDPDSLVRALSIAQTKTDSIETLHLLSEHFLYTDSDSAARYGQLFLGKANESADSNLIYEAYLQNGKILAFSGKWTQSKNMIRTMESYGRRNGYMLDQLGNYLGNIYSTLGDQDSAVIYYRLGMENVSDTVQKAILLSNIANIHEHSGNTVQAISDHLESIKIIQGQPNAHRYLASFYLNIGSLKSNSNKHREAINYYQQSIESARKSSMKYWEGFASINLAAKLEVNFNQLDSAYSYYVNARRIFSQLDDPQMSTLLWSRLGEYFQTQSLPDSAIFYLKKAEQNEKYIEDPKNKLMLWHSIAQYYQEQGNLDTALAYAKKLEEADMGTISLFYIEEFYYTLFELYEAIENYKKSSYFLQQFVMLHDSISGLEHQNKVSELEITYETEKKDNEIASLSQQAQIRDLQLTQRNNQLIGAGVILLVLVLGGVVISQQRKFRHQQAVSDMEQQMLRLQMNPHFIFNALASIQNFILQSNTKESVSYLAKFGKLMRQILEHSREEFITIEEEADMLKNYIEIQQLRFQNSFGFSIEIDPSIDPEETKIPPLFAQPFVENAIEHGLKDKASDGMITIRFAANAGNIQLEVEDNGSGIHATANTQKEHKSLANVITKERLAIFEKRFKQRFKLDVSMSAGGTHASILLPTA